jgi:hypothetical protein
MQKTYLSILFSVFALISSSQSFGQCVITDLKDCEKNIYKVDANKNTTEIIVDSCDINTETIKFSYNPQKQCTGIAMSAGTTKFTYDINKKLIKANMNASGSLITNTFQYIGKNLSKIVTKMDMMGMKIEVNTKYTYVNNDIFRIDVAENMTNQSIIALDSIVFTKPFPQSSFDNNSQGVRDFILGFYTGMGAFDSLLDGLEKPVKSYYLHEPNTCDAPIKVEFEYEFSDLLHPTIIKKKTCNGETTIEKHLVSVECK